MVIVFDQKNKPYSFNLFSFKVCLNLGLRDFDMMYQPAQSNNYLCFLILRGKKY